MVLKRLHRLSDSVAGLERHNGEWEDHVDGRFCEQEADIERLEAKRQAYDPDDIARGGAFPTSR
jgi:ParB family chromosome partitioning protein